MQTAPERRIRSELLCWDDPDSGDALTVEVRGSDDFLALLPGLGFRSAANNPEPRGVQGDGGAAPVRHLRALVRESGTPRGHVRRLAPATARSVRRLADLLLKSKRA